MESQNWIITKLCKSITKSGKDEYINVGKPRGNMVHDFRLFNEDGIIVAYGVSDNARNLEPVTYYSKVYGCTRIQYRENSYWEL